MVRFFILLVSFALFCAACFHWMSHFNEHASPRDINNSLRIGSQLFYAPSIALSNPSFRKFLRTPVAFHRKFQLGVLLLLLAGDVSQNPGPQCSSSLRLGTMNARSAQQKAGLINDLCDIGTPRRTCGHRNVVQ